ncbi:YARHG domain-containing protein [Carboxylicivirga sp. RSCT41]|uniref:YARHG domain-containing protein n=1 Tax=Carboxylicivirga agarovorans TaxID=3417570 RepID=UPI003D34CF43
MKLQYIIIFLIFWRCNTPESSVIYSEIKNPETGEPIQLSKKLIESEVDLRLLSMSDLRLLRNEIYARKGYVFKSKELTLHFKKFQWYKPKYEGNEIDNYLNEIDKSNINWIVDIENYVRPGKLFEERKKSLRFVDFLEILPEIKLPSGPENWSSAKIKSEIDQNVTLQALWDKYDKYGSTFGKISLTDSLFAIGINYASDFYNYTTFLFVNKEDQELGRKQLPLSFISTADNFDDMNIIVKDTAVIEYYRDVTITEDLKMIVANWNKKMEYDSIGHLIKTEFSDTTVVVDDFY